MIIHHAQQPLAAKSIPMTVIGDVATAALPAIPWSAVLRRVAVIAVAIGTALAVVNQGAALFGDASVQVAPFVLGFATPFVVIALSQVLGHRAYWRHADSGPGDEESLWRTVAGHGIPVRALTVAAVVGSVMTPAVIALSPADAAGSAHLPWGQVAQVYILPLVFGVLSQALAYRRAGAADTADARPPAARPMSILGGGRGSRSR